jgi:hypothetical protein
MNLLAVTHQAMHSFARSVFRVLLQGMVVERHASRENDTKETASLKADLAPVSHRQKRRINSLATKEIRVHRCPSVVEILCAPASLR